ncbi:MAG: hypothetical protein JRD05_00790 [Deltaproteobacteria bacterium]|nr:hypothetical protein [Deltaproteobacteria bacterium]
MKKILCFLILFFLSYSAAYADMRVCINKATGKLIESQGGGDKLHSHQVLKTINEAYNIKYKIEKPKKTIGKLIVEFAPEIEAATEEYRQANLNTLTQNAIGRGYKVEDIEVKYVSDEEFKTLLDFTTAPTPEEVLKAEQEAMIKAMIRQIAIERLQGEGKLFGYDIE